VFKCFYQVLDMLSGAQKKEAEGTFRFQSVS